MDFGLYTATIENTMRGWVLERNGEQIAGPFDSANELHREIIRRHEIETLAADILDGGMGGYAP